MTLFEYLAAGFVLILSLAVIRAVAGVPYALRPTGRYWVHVVYLSMALASCLVTFWAFWFNREVEWTFFRFTIALAVPVMNYVYISLLVPADPSTVASWRDHFFGVRIPLFTSGILLFGVVVISNHSNLGIPLLHSSHWGVYAAIGIYAIALTSARPSLHAALAVAFACLVALIFLVQMARPDPFASLVP